jgi:23S rRNA pseudouridine1911/1915/1917 synthase
MLKTIKIIYQDDSILVVNKPAGISVVPQLENILNKELKVNSNVNYYPCHRLDQETSGLVIFARGRLVQEKVMLQFKDHKVFKLYIAFVQGKLNKSNFKINFPIEHKPSETNVSLLEERKNFSVVEINPLTGRTNQIRIHFKLIGHPLVGERRFAFAKDFNLKFRRTALHACFLEFVHPLTGEKLSLKADLPDDMNKFLLTHN